ncbi:periplasmic heavy metal sensor [Sagittula sp. SSi028]|uniref:periplasmic heavy metal sensor n=1 Tax=Sagittula sp. SSi028 TaxID=3400636 RepID=UPI003AF45359
MAENEKTTGRGVRWALIASLAVNFVVIGAVAGFVWMGPPEPQGRPGGADPSLPYTRALSEPQRDALGEELRGGVYRDRKVMRDVRNRVLEDYRAALDLLRSDPFDPVAFEQLLAEQAAHSAEVRLRGQGLLADYVARMSPDDRARYADRLEETLENYQNRKKGPKKPKPDDR